jgi:hypothetical protein
MQLLVDGHNKYRNIVASGNLAGFSPARRMAKQTWDSQLAQFADLNTKQCKMVKLKLVFIYKFIFKHFLRHTMHVVTLVSLKILSSMKCFKKILLIFSFLQIFWTKFGDDEHFGNLLRRRSHQQINGDVVQRV